PAARLVGPGGCGGHLTPALRSLPGPVSVLPGTVVAAAAPADPLVRPARPVRAPPPTRGRPSKGLRPARGAAWGDLPRRPAHRSHGSHASPRPHPGDAVR